MFKAVENKIMFGISFLFHIKTLVSSLEQKIDETEKRFKETSKISEERLKQALDAEAKIVHLKTAMHKYLLLVS